MYEYVIVPNLPIRETEGQDQPNMFISDQIKWKVDRKRPSWVKCGWSHRFLMKARQPPALQAITSWQGRSDTEGALSRLLRIVVCERTTFLRKDKLRVDSGRSVGFEFDSQLDSDFD